ncbi:MAG: hypothetical protein QG574_1526 [Cyanobacteriota bacterium erpe_2018_sw_21hr_WHONDRS-SW48-000092_B_bin.40]|jgi:hypothetical protein|nr:hypothetical protein [Cyanobacteriota bacterium erpe_2018_sw_21hr_WHONDRS-SW48-000092_B_bin.40]
MIEHIEAPDHSDASASAPTNTNGTSDTNNQKGSSKNSRQSTQTLDREERNNILDGFAERWAQEPAAPIKNLWFNGANFLIMAFGVVIPILLPAWFAVCDNKRLVLLLFSHPLETLAAIALCLSIPITNLKLHRAICKGNFVFGLKPGLAAGLAFGTAATIATGCLAANIVNVAYIFAPNSLLIYNLQTVALLYTASALVSLQLVLAIRKTKELDSARRRILTYLSVGALTAAAILVGSEIQTLVCHYFERQALNSNAKISQPALSLLRKSNCERQLRLLCADTRSAGFAGMFIPIKQSEAERLYFMLEGKPFVIENKTDSAASIPVGDVNSLSQTYYMSAEELKNFAIGEKIPGISLTRSTINGNLHPDSLSGTLVWTMVFQNDGREVQPARAEIALPENAAITGAKVWINGESITGEFTQRNSQAAFSYTPGLDGRLTELGSGKYLLQSGTLQPDSQVKMQVTMVLPMDLEQLENAQIKLPQIVASNFSLEGDHNLELLSDNNIENSYSAFTTGQRADGLKFLSGALTADQIENSPVSILCNRHPITALASCKDTGLFKDRFHKDQAATATAGSNNDNNGLYLIRQIEQTVASAPGRVAVVLDGSSETAKYLDQIKLALQRIPSGIPVSLMVASNEDKTFTKPEDLKTAMTKLKEVNFTGGQENLKTLVKAAEFAGQTKEGVVLWIHGKQPAFHKEIYIISPFAFKPALYEFSYDAAEVVDDNFFRNHSELANFTQVTRSGDQLADLSRFFSRWQAGRHEYTVVSKLSASPIPNAVTASGAVESEVRSLLARSISSELIAQNAAAESASFARTAGVVSLNSSIFFKLREAPVLAGATNGTIAPQDMEGTVVYGVNTAGTVRVNNLANLEALLNIIANCTEAIMLIGGIVSMIKGFLLKGSSVKLFQKLEVSRSSLILGGVICIMIGLAFPGMLNFLVASARDAALFN